MKVHLKLNKNEEISCDNTDSSKYIPGANLKKIWYHYVLTRNMHARALRNDQTCDV